MAPRLIQYDDSIDFIWQEVVYTEARLMADPQAADLAPRVTACIARVDGARGALLGVMRAEIVAQASVDAADDQLDGAVGGLGKTLDRVVDGDHDDPRWNRYFQNTTPRKVAVQGLEAEVKTVRTWPASLASEEERALQRQADPMAKALARGDEALAARTTAAGKRRDFNARDKAKLVDHLNDLRLDLHADLTKRVIPNKLDRAWPDGFFRKSAPRSVVPADATPADPQPA